jgi:ABC-type Fe3+/spermidine/putrescine transport system ATPase subunit
MSMQAKPAPLALERLCFAYGGAPTVRDVSLAAEPGELVVLVGPSGCGKSTLLRLVAGLLRPDSGEVRIDGADIGATPPERRQVGWVPQSYALFDHLSVAENIAFGPRMQGCGRAEQQSRVAELLTLCQIGELAERPVRALSGGQRQRVAIARALAVRPRVLLLDEPLAALDPQLRHELRGRLVELIRASGVTTLFVTHDQGEALAVADRIAVLRAGEVTQYGTPQELWERPRSAFVARFLSAATVVEARRVGDRELEITPGLQLPLPEGEVAGDGPTIALALRPADLQWGRAGAGATVVGVEYAGGGYQLLVELPGGLRLGCLANHPVQLGAVGSVGVSPAARATAVGR